MDPEIARELTESVDAWVRFQGRRSADLSVENKELKALCSRAADALEQMMFAQREECEHCRALDRLIAELRKAAR